jgi:hypothetical protein
MSGKGLMKPHLRIVCGWWVCRVGGELGPAMAVGAGASPEAAYAQWERKQ